MTEGAHHRHVTKPQSTAPKLIHPLSLRNSNTFCSDIGRQERGHQKDEDKEPAKTLLEISTCVIMMAKEVNKPLLTLVLTRNAFRLSSRPSLSLLVVVVVGLRPGLLITHLKNDKSADKRENRRRRSEFWADGRTGPINDNR